jgi:predicted RNase H-like nuclease (RuvC/YqgF family)
MKLTLGQAAKHAGRAKGTLSKALSNKHISAEKDEKGRWQIDPSELQRWMDANPFPNSTQNQATTLIETHENPNGNSELSVEVKLLREQIDKTDLERDRERRQLEDQIEDLRRRLDGSESERTRLTAQLTDQRAKPTEPSRRFFGLLKG